MIPPEKIKQQLKYTLEQTNFTLGQRYKGKVRDCYTQGNKIIMITTDRISAFDHVLGTIPFKGQILNQMAVFWFNKTKKVCPHHLIDTPDPNVIIVQRCEPVPIEMVVRGYLTGSLWRDYNAGKREMYGLKFNNGMKKDQKFDHPIITPTTKEEYGKHDLPISKEEIIKQGRVKKELYEQMEQATQLLYAIGVAWAAKQGLILVDTKYEFGLVDGKLCLMDEIHTPDSSRYWIAQSYQELFSAGKDQQMLDKENIRQWLIQKGFSGQGMPPKLTNEVRVNLATKYMEAYETITGEPFTAEVGDVRERIEKNLKSRGYLK